MQRKIISCWGRLNYLTHFGADITETSPNLPISHSIMESAGWQWKGSTFRKHLSDEIWTNPVTVLLSAKIIINQLNLINEGVDHLNNLQGSNCINCKRITITDIEHAGNCGHELSGNNLSISVKNTVVFDTTGGNHKAQATSAFRANARVIFSKGEVFLFYHDECQG